MNNVKKLQNAQVRDNLIVYIIIDYRLLIIDCDYIINDYHPFSVRLHITVQKVHLSGCFQSQSLALTIFVQTKHDSMK